MEKVDFKITEVYSLTRNPQPITIFGFFNLKRVTCNV